MRPTEPPEPSCAKADTKRDNRPEPAARPPLFSAKIRDRHLDRWAVVSIRQSTPQQVLDHRASAALQYQLVERAIAWGWPRERVLVLDEDQGHSGQSAVDRQGFQRLLAEVSLDPVGLVLGIDMSRLARSNKDGHQLLEVCALFQTLVADKDGLYDPADYHDRLLLGLKGTRSEAELPVLKDRLEQGRRHKAARGELFLHLPIGYAFLPSGEVGLDPDAQAQAVVRMVFDKFNDLRSAGAVCRYLQEHGIRLGVRPHSGPNRGQLEWRFPQPTTVPSMLRPPIYAGVYTHGRHPIDPRRKVPGRRSTGRTSPPLTCCQVVLPGRLPAYLTWEQFQANQRPLQQNQQRPTTPGVPRQGSALLGGLLFCGHCAARLRVSYGGRMSQARYFCRQRVENSSSSYCRILAAGPLDELLSTLVLTVVTPATLELSLAAAADRERARVRLDEQWQQRRERARFTTERACRQYDAVEPENRLVARELEHRWNQALQEQRQLDEDYDRFRQTQPLPLTAAEQDQIRTLAQALPEWWQAPSTPAAQRQAVLRQLVERMVVHVRGQSEWLDVCVQWAGGFVSEHALVRSVAAYEQLADYERLLTRVAELRTAGATNPAIAAQLNREEFHTPKRGGRFTSGAVRQLLSRRGLSCPREESLPRVSLTAGEWPLRQVAAAVGVSPRTLHRWRRRGWVQGRQLPGALGRWRVWVDEEELDRLRRLRRHLPDKSAGLPPTEFTTPKLRA